MIIEMLKDPWADNDNQTILYKNPKFEIPTGITVLVGRNGAGKTTLLRGIVDYCKKTNIPCFSYDNYSEGSDKAKSFYGAVGDIDSLCSTLFHSEGEQIYYNFCQKMKSIGSFCKEHRGAKEIVLCLDALDSGLDCDGIKQIRDVCNLIVSDNKDSEVYIILSANNYGLIKNQRCLDVYTGKFLTFNNFDNFEKFILDRYKEERATENV